MAEKLWDKDDKSNKSLFYRAAVIDRSTLDDKDRTAELSFSSETGVKRWFGNEFLSHKRGAVDLEQLKTTGAVLMNHDPAKIVGSIINATIRERRGVATIRFDDDEDGDRAWKKVRGGSLRGVSVGVLPIKGVEIDDGDTYENFEGPGIVFTNWRPVEISLTPIPADGSVGIGRELTRSLDGITIAKQAKEIEMEIKDIQEIVERAIEKKMESIQPVKAEDIAAAVKDALKREEPPQRLDDKTVRDLITRAGAVSPECKSEVVDMVMAGGTEADIQRHILNALADKPDAADTKSPEDAGPPLSRMAEISDQDFIGAITSPSILS